MPIVGSFLICSSYAVLEIFKIVLEKKNSLERLICLFDLRAEVPGVLSFGDKTINFVDIGILCSKSTLRATEFIRDNFIGGQFLERRHKLRNPIHQP